MQSPFNVKAVQTVTLLTMHVCMAECAMQQQKRTSGASGDIIFTSH